MDILHNTYAPHPVEADLLMRAKYESAFGIYDHYGPDDPEVPWPLMYKSEREDYNRLRLLDLRIDQFVQNKIGSLANISFDEFMNYPRRELLQLVDSCRKHCKILNNSTEGEAASAAAAISAIRKQREQ